MGGIRGLQGVNGCRTVHLRSGTSVTAVPNLKARR
jgi:hypothetical protein